MLLLNIKHYQFKKLLLGLIMLFLFSLMTYKLFLYVDLLSEKKQVTLYKDTTRLTPAEESLIREGDFILRKGFGYFSDIIASKLNNGTFDITHAGIIVKRKDHLYVIHSLSSDVSDFHGVQIQPLEVFLSYSTPEKIIITRTKYTDSLTGHKIALKAEEYLSKQIPFDDTGNFDDDNAFFCTEMIWHILEKDLKIFELPKGNNERKKFFYAIDNMYSTYYFDIIINQYTAKKTG